MGDLRLRKGIVWGFLDQAISSATNFGLLIVAGRWLGPSRLGVVAVGFAAYVLCLVLFRAFISSPFVVVSGSSPSEVRRTVTGWASTAAIVFALLAAISIAVIGQVAPGDIGRGLLLFAPWIGPALVQDFWRSVLFRDSRGAAAALNDGTWLAVMAASVLLTRNSPSEWVIVSTWGLGATAGAILGFLQTRYRVRLTRDWWRWWWAEIWPLGKWFGLDRAVLNLGTQGSIFLMAGFLSASDVGGLRAIQSVFAPLTLVGPAIVLPGLPAVERALQTSAKAAWHVALRLTALVTLVATGYLIIVNAWGDSVIPALFGRSFEQYGTLILPVAVGQLFLAARVGVALFFQASRRGRGLVLSAAVGSMVMLSAVWKLGHSRGITGAAWGLTLGQSVTAISLYALALLFRPSTDMVITDSQNAPSGPLPAGGDALPR